MKMYFGGKWVEKAETIPVLNPFDQSVIDTVPRGTSADVERAVTSAVRGAKAMAKLTAYERFSRAAWKWETVSAGTLASRK